MESPAFVAACFRGNRHDLVRIRHVERTKDDVQEAEQRRVRAKADRQREDRGRGKRLVRGEKAQRVAKVSHVGRRPHRDAGRVAIQMSPSSEPALTISWVPSRVMLAPRINWGATESTRCTVCAEMSTTNRSDLEGP